MGDIIKLETVANNLITNIRPRKEWPRFLRGNYVPDGDLLRGTMPVLRDIEMYLFRNVVSDYEPIEEGLDVNLAILPSLTHHLPVRSRIEQTIDDVNTIYTVLAFGTMRGERTFVDMARFPSSEYLTRFPNVKGFTLDQMRFMVARFLDLTAYAAEKTEARVERYELGLGLALKGTDVSIVVRDDRTDYSTIRTEPVVVKPKEIRKQLGLNY